MAIASHLLNRAIEFYQAGKLEEANRLLRSVINLDPTNQIAWNWYFETYTDQRELKRALEVYLLINPDNHHALNALNRLEQELGSQAASSAHQESRPVHQTPLSAQNQKTGPAQLIDQHKFIASPPAQKYHIAPHQKPTVARLIAFISVLLLAVLMIYAFKVQEQNTALQNDLSVLHTQITDLKVRLEVTSREKSELTKHHDKLWRDYQYLHAVYEDLSKAYLDLETILNDLTSDDSKGSGQSKSLLQDYSGLQKDYLSLNSEIVSLSLEYNDLITRYSSLYGWYEWMQIEKSKPPYITIHDRQLSVGFFDPYGNIQTWTKDVTELELAIRSAEKLRKDPPKISFQLGEVNVEGFDLSPFVDPGAFKDTIPEMYARAESEEQFIQEVWYIVSQFNVYPSDILTTPRHPLETFMFGGGNCADTSILLASMILAAPVDWEVQLVLMDSDHPFDAQEINHVIVSIDTGTNTYLIESTGTHDMLWPENIQAWYLIVY